eukprot:165556_1
MADLGSLWWLQLILFIVQFAIFMGLMEFFRWFPTINLYLSFVAFLVLFPFEFGLIPGFEEGGFGTNAKFMLIVPFLVWLCAWRLSYIPIDPDTNNVKAFTIKLCKKVFCCTPVKLTEDRIRPRPIMEWVWFLLAFVNIWVAVVPGFIYGSYLNPISGILLAFSFPFPQRSLKLNHYHGVHMSNKYNNGKVYDGVADGLTAFWVIAFTSWDLLFVFSHSTETFLIHSFHLVPNCVRCIVTGQHDLWAELRVFTFAVSLCQQAVMRAEQNPLKEWYLNTENVQFLMDAAESKALVEIWGAINVILVGIHVFLWVRELIRRRGVEPEDVEQILVPIEDPEPNSEV